ncbi:MAG TPA: NAD+ synthase [Candidatus Cryosericum sp.]|nr:NAD+ synthase [Candidatus Cryosericum sp.]
MTPVVPVLNNAMVADYLKRFIAEELHSSSFAEASIAVSGGLDSAVVLKLACDALGPSHVHPVFLPYKASSEESRRDARVIVSACGLPWTELDITGMADAYIALQPDIDRLRTGNLLARLRMAVIFDQSKKERSLVIGTSNKSELLVGYSTWYGDMACAMMPIGDLYKTQVRSLAVFLGVPQQIVEKPPSADLWTGQTDEGEIGVTYDMLDQVLFLLVDQRMSPDEVLQQGFEARLVQTIERKIVGSQFKRVLPPIAKVSQRTVATDFLYPRDWRA